MAFSATGRGDVARGQLGVLGVGDDSRLDHRHAAIAEECIHLLRWLCHRSL